VARSAGSLLLSIKRVQWADGALRLCHGGLARPPRMTAERGGHETDSKFRRDMLGCQEILEKGKQVRWVGGHVPGQWDSNGVRGTGGGFRYCGG